MTEAERLAEDLYRQFMNDDTNFDTMIEASIELRRLSAELSECKAAYESQFKELHAIKASLAAAPPAPQPQPVQQEPIAYLDIGAGGYLDLATDLTDEQLLALPKGRHTLVIAGTFGIDGYTSPQAAQPLTKTQRAEVCAKAESAMQRDQNLSWRDALMNETEQAHGITKGTT